MSFVFGNPNMFVMGTVDQTLYDRESGNVRGYDKLGNEAAVQYNHELTEVTGPLGSLVAAIPHTTRLTGTYTSAAFSLHQRAGLIGSQVVAGAPARYCEKIKATGATITVSKTPVKALMQKASDTAGWCYIHEDGVATYTGDNVGVDLTTGVVNFTAVEGKTYVVTYFVQNASAQQVGMKAFADPSIVSIMQKWNVFASQGGVKENGTLVGHLYVVVPLAMLEGDAGIDGNQTQNSTTPYNWRAILPSDNLPQCDICGDDDEYLAYYVYVPCGNTTQSVQDVLVVGDEIDLAIGDTEQVVVKYVMPGNQLAQPDYKDLTFVSSAPAIASVGEHTGIVTALAAGNAVITATLTGGTLADTCAVTVEE